ncbi:hypothetical protein C8R45DRAFT_1160696 [Mycena sanguinolenta]|nr:hypothetical protein C8R45DRAFT_1160696 [Mycena sanguinolenta]
MPLPAWRGGKEVAWLDGSCSLPASPNSSPRPVSKRLWDPESRGPGRGMLVSPFPFDFPPSLFRAEKLTASQRKRAYHHRGEGGVGAAHAHEDGDGRVWLGRSGLAGLGHGRGRRRVQGGLAGGDARAGCIGVPPVDAHAPRTRTTPLLFAWRYRERRSDRTQEGGGVAAQNEASCRGDSRRRAAVGYEDEHAAPLRGRRICRSGRRRRGSDPVGAQCGGVRVVGPRRFVVQWIRVRQGGKENTRTDAWAGDRDPQRCVAWGLPCWQGRTSVAGVEGASELHRVIPARLRAGRAARGRGAARSRGRRNRGGAERLRGDAVITKSGRNT